MPTFLLLLFFYVAGTFERESGKVIDGQLIKQIIELYGRKEAQTLSMFESTSQRQINCHSARLGCNLVECC